MPDLQVDPRELSETGTWSVETNACRIEFGEGTLSRLGDLACELGCRSVLVVTDPGIRAAGHVDRAVESLRGRGVAAALFDGVEENPRTSHVAAGVLVAQEVGVDGIVGLGGGSSMDCAKGINFLLTNGGRMEDYWGVGKATRPMLPSIGVPTTAGTGSEAQSFALISQEETGRKMACGDPKARFRGVILDPALVVSVPRRVAAVTAVDAVSHAVESYVTTRRSPMSQLYAREAWRLLASSLEGLMNDPGDPLARARMLLGAHFAGASIEQSMLGAAHACANPLTARCGVTHGAAVGLMLPPVVRFNTEVVGPLYDELRRAATADVPLDEHVAALREAAGLPGRIRDHGVPQERLEALAEEASTQWTAGFNPRAVTAKELMGIYEAAY